MLVFTFFILGFFRMDFYRAAIENQIENIIPAFENETVTLEGNVQTIRETSYGWTVEFAVSDPEGVTINWYSSSEPDLLPGDHASLTGTVSLYDEASNPGQFDSREYYCSLGITGKGTLKNSRVLERKEFSTGAILFRLKKMAGENLKSAAEMAGISSEDRGILKAILLGDRSEIADEDLEGFRMVGLSHILSISGLHISLIGMGLYQLCRKRIGMSFGVSGLLAGAVILLYGRMVSTGAACVRAILMFLLFLDSRRRGENYDSASAASLAGSLLLFEKPLLIFQAGFQLSFLAVSGVSLILPVLTGWWMESSLERIPAADRAFLFGFCMQAISLPAVLWHYYEYPVWGFLVNLLAIPFLAWLAASGGCAVCLGGIWLRGAAACLSPAALILKWYRFLESAAEKSGVAYFLTGRPLAWQLMIVLAVWGIFFGLMMAGDAHQRKIQKKFPTLPSEIRRIRKGFALICLFILSLICLRRIHVNTLEITMLDVGQGDGIVMIAEDGSAILIDGGSTSISQVGEKRILPFLKYMGVSELQFVLLSHLDQDHTSALEELLEADFPIGQLYLSGITAETEKKEEILQMAEEYNLPAADLFAGNSFENGTISLLCLHPREGETVSDENGASQVLLLTCGEFRMLLTGDIPEEKEEAFIQYLISRTGENKMPITVLKTAHHGSRTSTGESLLSFFSPEVALISCGENNLYGHPHEETLSRLREAGCSYLITSERGAITILTDGTKYRIETMKETE